MPPTPPGVGLVQHVVVNQAGGVDHLDDFGQAALVGHDISVVHSIRWVLSGVLG
jgi:hypothetical protein